MLLLGELGARSTRPLFAWHIQAYGLCEHLTEILICLILVFSPWAFGTTQPWSIWTMNTSGYVLGILLVIKLTIRYLHGYPPRGDVEPMNCVAAHVRRRTLSGSRYECASEQPGHLSTHFGFLLNPRIFLQGLAALTFAILGYCLLAAVNARATFDPASLSFDYHHCIPWLPHSLDSQSTWCAFWNYLALACSFWAVLDWLADHAAIEQRGNRVDWANRHAGDPAPVLPARFRRLLWVLAINGALLGLEGIGQRFADSPELLFLLKPEIHQDAQTQFASYAYRANAAQYFNLLWPAILGFWWVTHRSASIPPISKHLLLGCAIIAAACPILSTARGAALVELGMLLTAALVLLSARSRFAFRNSKRRKARMIALGLFFVVVLGVGLGLGWKALRPRMEQFKTGLASRQEVYERARPMSRDYPVFGTGPGTFERVFQLYRISPDAYWPAQVHNDWLETRITFGWVGSLLIGLAFLTVLLRSFAAGALHGSRQLVYLLWLSLAGCLAQARWDFPLQIYSVLFVFLIWCAVLFALSRKA